MQTGGNMHLQTRAASPTQEAAWAGRSLPLALHPAPLPLWLSIQISVVMGSWGGTSEWLAVSGGRGQGRGREDPSRQGSVAVTLQEVWDVPVHTQHQAGMSSGAHNRPEGRRGSARL